jgi:hypothetical protein
MNANLIEMEFLAGKSLAQIGRECDLSRERIRQILKESGQTASELQKQRDRLWRDQINELAHDHARFEMTEKLGLSICQVDRICRKFGISTKHKKS